MNIIEEKYNLDDLLLIPQRSTLTSRQEINLIREFRFYHSPKILKCIPIMCANMPPIATFEMGLVFQKNKMITCLHKYYNTDQLIKMFNNGLDIDYNWITIGFDEKYIDKLETFINNTGKQPNIVIDVPNAYIEKFVKFCARIRSLYQSSIIVGGNIATADICQELIIHGGLDIVKCQIGVGTACRTRMVAGVGYGSASCIMETSSAAHGLKNGEKRLGLICSDGGIKNYGDAVKSTALGADFVMSGSLFGGTDECTDAEWEYENSKYELGYWENGDWIDGKYPPNFSPKKKYMIYYGLSTHFAQEKHEKIKKTYRASEGDILKIPYKGKVQNIINELLGGYRSACTYIGSVSIKDMPKCAKFNKISKIHSSL